MPNWSVDVTQLYFESTLFLFLSVCFAGTKAVYRYINPRDML